MAALKNTLEKMLEVLLKNQQLKPLLGDHQKTMVIQNVTKLFEHKRVDLNNLSWQKILATALLNEVLKIHNPLFAQTLNPFLQPRLDGGNIEKNIEALKTQLKPTIDRILRALNRPEFGKTRTSEELDALSESLTQILSQGFEFSPNKECMMEHEPCLEFLKFLQAIFILQMTSQREDKQIEEADRNVYGGINPKETGGVLFVVQQIVTSMQNYTLRGSHSGESYSVMEELARFDGKPDYNGFEAAIRHVLQALGGLIKEVEMSVSDIHSSPRPKSPFDLP